VRLDPHPGGPRPGLFHGATVWETALYAVLGVAMTAGLGVWFCGQLAGTLFGGGWPSVSPVEAGGLLVRLPSRLGDPATAWPADVRANLPGAAGFYATVTLLIALLVLAALAVRHVVAGGRRRGPRAGSSGRPRGSAWATRRQLAPLAIREPRAGRLTLGRVGGRLVGAEARQSVIVVAPTQSLKTTGLAIPALLEWEGPAVAASVKSDLLRDTLARRRELGDVHVYDPTAATGSPTSGWTPLRGCQTWQGAQRLAAWLAAAAQPGRTGLADADFWYAAAAKLLAPLLFAAAVSERSMADVVRWVDTQEQDEVSNALVAADVEEAYFAAEATWKRDERQRSSIYTTTETVLAAYADPGVLAASLCADLTPDSLLDGGRHTAYLCAPAHEQQRLAPLFATLIQELVAAVYDRATRTGRPLDPPLLIVLDEAANIAPLRDLDTLAATAAGQGIQLVSVFQDLAQIKDRWGTRAATIVNNHRAKIIGAGVSDPDTLDYVARVLGDEEVRQVSSTAGREGHGSTTQSTTYRALAPANVVRENRPGTGLLVYGHLPPAQLELRPWFADRDLRRLAAAQQPARVAKVGAGR
jgi:type IV secretion system protein VirD4